MKQTPTELAASHDLVMPENLYFYPTSNGKFKAMMDFSDPATPGQIKETFGALLTRDQINNRDHMAGVYNSAIAHAQDATARGLIFSPG